MRAFLLVVVVLAAAVWVAEASNSPLITAVNTHFTKPVPGEADMVQLFSSHFFRSRILSQLLLCLLLPLAPLFHRQVILWRLDALCLELLQIFFYFFL